MPFFASRPVNTTSINSPGIAEACSKNILKRLILQKPVILA